MTDTPNRPPLSPAAWQVDSAASVAKDHCKNSIAAALRAVADQVVPDEGDRWTRDMLGDAWTRWKERKLIRRDLFAIAAELESNTLSLNKLDNN